MIYGGYVADIPLPHRRRWPDGTGERRRDLDITILAYDVVGASHWWVGAREEPNPLWDSRENDWRCAWDDREADGDEAILRERFDDHLSAVEYIADLRARYPEHNLKVNNEPWETWWECNNPATRFAPKEPAAHDRP